MRCEYSQSRQFVWLTAVKNSTTQRCLVTEHNKLDIYFVSALPLCGRKCRNVLLSAIVVYGCWQTLSKTVRRMNVILMSWMIQLIRSIFRSVLFHSNCTARLVDRSFIVLNRTLCIMMKKSVAVLSREFIGHSQLMLMIICDTKTGCIKLNGKLWKLLLHYLRKSHSRPAVLYNLGSGSWLTLANGAAVHYVAIHCLQ